MLRIAEGADGERAVQTETATAVTLCHQQPHKSDSG
jgi:hypothetical protein